MSIPSLQRALNYEFRAQGEENREKVHRERPDADDVTITPSQAEGDRETVERDLGDRGATTTSAARVAARVDASPRPASLKATVKPSSVTCARRAVLATHENHVQRQ